MTGINATLRKTVGERGMSLMTVMAVMTLVAIALLAAAPTVMNAVQREKELESIRRGEEVADAIREYVNFHQGQKLPDSIDELLEGLPQGTKRRMILRPAAAVDPLSEDGQWRLISPTSRAFLNFGQRVQRFNSGLLPATPNQYLNRYAVPLASAQGLGDNDDLKAVDESEYEVSTSNTPFIGVASQSKDTSVVTYYGIENHSKWIFTPMFRGVGSSRPANAPRNGNTRSSSNSN
ncbi:MAG: hypothetical protein DWQ47_13650 [Acidobacteria bacterium]|nr:MAG: hypothetical protein DWQ32_01050 [Acidobacteriota bacterium]REK02882.1 MAG: hypothetical protein DWQ38_11085 [Acidobacteriota bacterium]REK13314.1 MAG: hypothetical protein DWQ43_06740 [Acidobacteriota bacterium]REK41308.1 MAG: hypothetical protein DWQ47_13650 [Acidobacteriota bacterium]